MIAEVPPEAAALWRSAARGPLVPDAAWRPRAPLEAPAVEAVIPHRGALLLLDRIEYVDRAGAAIVCVSRAGRIATLVQGHFPGRPVWPGVLQVEAVGQAGLCLLRLPEGADGVERTGTFALTHILGAQFIRPVSPAGEVVVIARIVREGLFHVVVGQCLQQGGVCSIAALRGIHEEKEP